jgi:hypothetical protein
MHHLPREGGARWCRVQYLRRFLVVQRWCKGGAPPGSPRSLFAPLHHLHHLPIGSGAGGARAATRATEGPFERGIPPANTSTCGKSCRNGSGSAGRLSLWPSDVRTDGSEVAVADCKPLTEITAGNGSNGRPVPMLQRRRAADMRQRMMLKRQGKGGWIR